MVLCIILVENIIIWLVLTTNEKVLKINVQYIKILHTLLKEIAKQEEKKEKEKSEQGVSHTYVVVGEEPMRNPLKDYEKN